MYYAVFDFHTLLLRLYMTIDHFEICIINLFYFLSNLNLKRHRSDCSIMYINRTIIDIFNTIKN